MKKIGVIVMLLTIAATSTFGMGSAESGDGNAAADRNRQLLIYSNSASDGRGEWITELAKNEGFNIAVVPIPGGELTNRLIAEKNNSQADLVFGLNNLEYEKLKKAKLLQQYKPVWANEVDMSLGDKDGYYYPIVIQPLVLIYNNQLKDVPKDWTDLTNPKYKDKYNIFSLNGGTAKNILSSILIRYKDPKGELGISKEGWNVAKAYIQNAHIEIKGEDYVGNVINGSRPMTMMWGSGVLQHQKERKYKFGIMSPAIGVPYVVEQVGIIANGKKAALAIDFANWFGSKEVQAAWSNKFGTIPAHPKALEQASTDLKEFISAVHSQNMDWALVAENIDAWVEKVELEFIK